MSDGGQSLATASGDVWNSGLVRLASAATLQTVNDSATALSGHGDLYHAIGDLLSRLDVLEGIISSM